MPANVEKVRTLESYFITITSDIHSMADTKMHGYTVSGHSTDASSDDF